MALHRNESAENYLETILELSQQLPAVRSVDIANELGYKKSSVSVAMKKLRENSLIAMDADGHITLLPDGEAIARKVYERHELLTRFFMQLGVCQETAAADACKVEHILCLETFDCIKRQLKTR